MPNTLIVGTQWGDEGKGKTIDLIAGEHEVVARFQGGPNAGHSVVIEGKRYALHTIPSGILRHELINVIGKNVLINPEEVLKEIRGLQEAGVEVNPGNLMIHHTAPLTLAYHVVLDQAANKHLGTTNKGIGPTYVDKTRRSAIKMWELADERRLREKIERDLGFNNHLLAFHDVPPLSLEEVLGPLMRSREALLPFVSTEILNILKRHNGAILGEGAQGTVLDIDHGTYPYVTPSNTTMGGFYTGLEAGFVKNPIIRGIIKAYTTRVGSGPFPAEQDNENGKRLRTRGHERGTTTGRDRRCGWLDLPVVQFAIDVNGIDILDLTKLDVLDEESEIPVCVGYKMNGKRVTRFPYERLEDCEPVYHTFPGWKTDISGVRRWEDLPENARRYVKAIEDYLEVPIKTIGVGPDREQTIIR